MASYGRSSLPFAGPSRLKTLKTLTTLQNPLATSNTAGTSYPKASYGRASLPFASLSTLQTLQNGLGTLNPAGTSYPKATSMASYGRSSLRLRLKTLTTLQSSCYVQPRRHKLPQGHINGCLWAFKPAVGQALKA